MKREKKGVKSRDKPNVKNNLQLNLNIRTLINKLGIGPLDNLSRLFDACIQVGKGLLVVLPDLLLRTLETIDDFEDGPGCGLDLERKREHVVYESGIEVGGVGVDAVGLGVFLGGFEDVG